MNRRVLIIDDDTNLLSGLRRQLHGEFRVETADSGERALAMLKSAEPFAVALCDMRMPGLNGIETLARIRESSPDTVRVMLTGNVDQQTAVDAVNAGQVFRFLHTPGSVFGACTQSLTSGSAARRPRCCRACRQRHLELAGFPSV